MSYSAVLPPYLLDLTGLVQTHNIALVQPITDFVVSVKDGRIFSQGSLTDALTLDASLTAEVREEEKVMAQVEELDTETAPPYKNDAQKQNGQLIAAEEIEEGHVDSSSCKSISVLLRKYEPTGDQ